MAARRGKLVPEEKGNRIPQLPIVDNELLAGAQYDRAKI